MYLKNKSKRITLRLDETQFNFICGSADLMGISPSDFLRQVVTTSYNTCNMKNPKETAQIIERGKCCRENETTIQHDKL